jgi:hypothetical protein
VKIIFLTGINLGKNDQFSSWLYSIFKCSYSIKAVLSALYLDDPELNYDNLDLIHHGGDAMDAYSALVNKSKKGRRHPQSPACLLPP